MRNVAWFAIGVFVVLALPIFATEPSRPSSESTPIFVWPLQATNFTPTGQDFAQYNYVSTNKYHTAFDIPAASGTLVLAAAGGRVRALPMTVGQFNGDNHCMGNIIILDHSFGTSASGPFTLYGHLLQISVSNGQDVAQGATIGQVGRTPTASRPGCTGLAAGSEHLHFEVKTAGVLGSSTDSGPEWGYTSAAPDSGIYRDPAYGLHGADVLNSTTATVTQAGAGASMRIGPNSNYRCPPATSGGVCRTTSQGQTFTAIAQAQATSNCSMGWLQLKPTNGSKFTDGSRINSDTGATSEIPELWSCRGHGNDTWLQTSGGQQETLTASISPSSSGGQAPLNNVSLTATHGGTAAGTLNYTFYCNRGDSGTNITASDFKIDGVNANGTGGTVLAGAGHTFSGNSSSFTVNNLCHYSSAGLYQAKVIIERSSLAAESRSAINVTQPPAGGNTNTSLSTNPWRSIPRHPVLLSSTVTPQSGGGTPTGSVTFTDTGLTIGSGGLSGGSTSISPTFNNTGAHPIQAIYGGDGSFNGSSSSVSNLRIDPLLPRGDVDENQQADIMWRNNATGGNAYWSIVNQAYATAISFPAVSDSNWRIEASGDFNADGRPDLVWRNIATGQTALWLLLQNNYLGSASLPALAPGSGWEIAGTGDFNADGWADIVLRKYGGDGAVACWTMNATSATGGVGLGAVADANWRLVAVADMNRNGSPDLLWRHQLTGQNVVWLMNGTSASTSVNLPTVSDTHWLLVGAADYNDDGNPDLLWRNDQTGGVAVWLMNTTTFAGSFSLPAVTDQNWKIVAPR